MKTEKKNKTKTQNYETIRHYKNPTQFVNYNVHTNLSIKLLCSC